MHIAQSNLTKWLYCRVQTRIQYSDSRKLILFKEFLKLAKDEKCAVSSRWPHRRRSQGSRKRILRILFFLNTYVLNVFYFSIRKQQQNTLRSAGVAALMLPSCHHDTALQFAALSLMTRSLVQYFLTQLCRWLHRWILICVLGIFSFARK